MDTVRTPTRRQIYLWVSLLLWVSVIVGLLLLLTFGEIGLLLSVLFYLIALVLATKILMNEYRRSRIGSNQVRNNSGLLIFSIDAFAAAAVFLGIVMEAAATKYGHIYVLAGAILIGIACVLWINSLMLAMVDYFQTTHKIIPMIAVGFTLFSVLTAFILLLQPAGFWGR